MTSRYNDVCRRLVGFCTFGILLSVAFGMAAVHEQDWWLLPLLIAAFLMNFGVIMIIVADGIKRFGNKYE